MKKLEIIRIRKMGGCRRPKIARKFETSQMSRIV
jgi:hypothetical protein